MKAKKSPVAIAGDLNARGRRISRQGNFQSARRYFERALELDPSSDLARYNIAMTDYGEGNLAAAKRQFKQFVKASRSASLRADSLVRLGDIAYQEGNWDGAYANYEAVLAIEIGDTHSDERGWIRSYAFFGMGLIEYERGNLKHASEMFYRSIQEDPRYVEARVWYARVYAQMGGIREAIVIIEGALTLSPDDPDLHIAIAEYYRSDSRFLEARFHYERAVQLGSIKAGEGLEGLPEGSEEGWLGVGHDHERKGDTEFARYAYERAAESGDPAATAALSRLNKASSGV